MTLRPALTKAWRTMTPDEQLDRLDHELRRLQEAPGAPRGTLRLSETALRSCSKWKWERHGWSLSDGQSCGIMNGCPRERRTALLAVLGQRGIDRVEFVDEPEILEVVPEPS